MERYESELIGDFAHWFPGVDALDFQDQPGGGYSRLTYRRAKALIDWLPGESRMKTRVREEMTPEQREKLKLQAATMTGHGPWDNKELLLAEIADRLTWVRHAVLQAGSKDGKSPFEPEAIPRPGVEPKKNRRSQFVVPDATGDEEKFGAGINVVTEERVALLRRLRASRGAPE